MHPTRNSSSSLAADARLLRVPLAALHAHPANSNVMAPDELAKLRRNIEREGRYEPLVARPHPDRPGEWQLLNGVHRVQVLAALGEPEAVVFPWECDDETALVLLATLNRLHGEDVPARRAALLAELTALAPAEQLALLLPEDATAITQTLAFAALDADALLADLTAATNQRVDTGRPRLVSFSLEPADEAAVEQAVAAAMQQLDGRNRRGRALACICAYYLEGTIDG